MNRYLQRISKMEFKTIAELKDHHHTKMIGYDDEMREFREQIPQQSQTCDYFIHRQQMSNYHRGAYISIIAVDKLIKDK